MTIEQAVILATTALSGKKDLEGFPAILHSLRVMQAGENDDEMIVGVLHDVVEDTQLTFADLQNAGCSNEQIAALMLLTHSKEMPYLDYVERIAKSGNRLAIKTKLHDLQDNLQRGRKYGHTRIVHKHEQALKVMTEDV